MRTLILVCAFGFSVPAFAQSSLGITGAAFSLGTTEDEGGDARVEGAASVDVAITQVHGFQGDLRFADTAGGGIGSLAAHVYMAPGSGRKYGLFAALNDVDGRSLMWGAFGAEAMLPVSDDTMIELRAGIGAADSGGLDFVFAGASIAHALSPAVEIDVSLDLADFDEAAFRATSYDAAITLRYSPEGAPWGAYARLSQGGLEGRDGAGAETRIGLGLTLDLGTAGGTDPRTRHFGATDPVAPLVRRGLW